MQTKQTTSTRLSRQVMCNIKATLANAPRKHIGFALGGTYSNDQGNSPVIERHSIEHYESKLLTDKQLYIIEEQQRILEKINDLAQYININKYPKLGLDKLILPEIKQRLMMLDQILADADHANVKLGRGAIIAKARAEQQERDEEIAKAEAMKEAIAANKGTNRANEIMNKKAAA